MPFVNGRFAPETIPDPRARRALVDAAAGADGAVRLLTILIAAVRAADRPARDLIEGALRTGSVDDLVAPHPPPAAGGGPRGRDAFTPTALRALDEFAAVLRGSGGLLDPAALELLLHSALTHLDAADRAAVPALDAGAAARALHAALSRHMDPRADGRAAAGASGDEPFRLPSHVLPSDDLTFAARRADPGPGYPYDGEPAYDRLFDSLARPLHRRQHPHALLVGERGVGKLTLLAEFARRAALGRFPFLAARRFVRVDGRYIPPDESRPRLAAALAHVADRPDLVVCLDGMAALLRADRGGSNKPVLLEALARAQCRVVGLLTPREFEEVAADDPEFADLFTRVDVPEPDADLAVRLVGHYARSLAAHYAVRIDPAAARQAVLLTANYILNDQLPAKAVRVLTRACEEADYDRTQLGRPRPGVGPDDVVRIVADLSGVPADTLRGVGERTDYERGLREVVFGQDHAVRDVATELGLIKAGMVDPTKPASVLLFLGQTGTGKTETAKALARFYSASKRLKTYTLGNCVEPHSVATIIGVPPGYVGSDQGGRLINELNADPYCVVLLDEADKAHPDVLQPFLNLFDEGWVTDQRGVKAYGTKAIFILTTNVGQRMIAEMAREGRPVDEIAARMKEALSQIRHSKSDRPVFTPEFLARVKRVIVFKSLDEGAMRAIARKQLADLARSWAEGRGKRLVVPDGLADHIGGAAFRVDDLSGGKEGGRVVRKLMAEWVEAPVQRAMADQPAAYQNAAVVALAFQPAPDPPDGQPYPPPELSVRFSSAAGSGLSHGSKDAE